MELTKLKVERFKRVREVELDLAPLNILVGSNGSGKSSIIQAAHLACCLLRQADRIRDETTSTVGINELDYLPTNKYWSLGHGGSWGNKSGTPSSQVTFFFQDEEGESQTWTEFRSARNAGISVRGSIDRSNLSSFRGSNTYFSAYIPGVSGIPNEEQRQSKRVVLRACSYGDSNVYLRNVLVLLKENEENIRRIETWLSEVLGQVSIQVDHDNDRDLTIAALVEINGVAHPLELIGSGYIQLIQIFSYILLFNPMILLIDEPDIHLHPDVQEKVTGLFSRVAEQMGMKILMTTHSPFIVRGAPLSSKVYWIKDGQIETGSRESVELALGWGAFGKRILLISEDKNNNFLRKLIGQWPDIESAVGIIPGAGYKNLPSPDQARDLSAALGGKFLILVHRDRDSLTREEILRIERSYLDAGVHLWTTEQSDIEAYFCGIHFLQGILGCSEEAATAHIEGVLIAQAQDIRAQFNSQRAAHNQELHAQGGSPINDLVWEGFQAQPLRGSKGKFVFNQLKNRIQGNVFNEEKLLSNDLQIEIAMDLRQKLEGLLGI